MTTTRTRRAFAAALAALAGSLSCAALGLAQDGAGRDLPIKKIVLYKHGVGYFEREGTVDGDATLPLSFKAAQMKDVLKSLYAVDLDGGRVSSILYDSKDPIEKQLEDILFRVPEANALTRFLTQLKGASVKVTIGAREVSGRVLGIEPIQRTTEGGGTTTTYKLVLLGDDGAILPLELLEAAQVEILDDTVRADLARMMEIYQKARYADRKTVTLRADGDGERRIRVGYIIETPIWKTSYRLLLDRAAPPRLQGWAIVENRTDEDWNGVQLSFVAGSPLSFVLDLYTSYYPERPVLDMRLGAADAPAVRAERTKSAAPAPRSRRAAVPEAAREMEGIAPDADLGDLLERSMEPAAQGVQIGDLFAYEAKGPVTIRQGQAALVPILFEAMPESSRVLYYRRTLSSHPSHAVRLANSTELTLEKGPVTVFEQATCLGEAMLHKTLAPGQHEILPYALETGVEVEPEVESRSRPISKGVLTHGVLMLTQTAVIETSYHIRNKTRDAHELLLDHPASGGGFALTLPAEALEQLPGYYRFEVELGAGATTVFTVREENEVSNRVSIAGQDTRQLRLYADQAYLSAAARQLLAKVAGLMEERATLDAGLSQLTEERARLLRDQQNLRQNIQVLRDSPEERKLREQYVARLTEAMRRVDAIDVSMSDQTDRRQKLDETIGRELRAFADE